MSDKELLVDARPAPGDSASSSGTAMLPFIGPAAVGALLAKYASPLMGLGGLAAAVVVVLVLRKPDEGRFVLRVEDGVLDVRRERGKEPVARVALADVTNVTLDRQAAQTGARGGAPAERTHIALERTSGDPILVPEQRITSIEAQEWYGKVRVFLRKNGWVPLDEREGSAPPSGS